MFRSILLILFLFVTVVNNAQNMKLEGAPFDFDENFEKDAKLVLADNYSHYLFSAHNNYGVSANKGVAILRKFDQKSQLLDEYILSFPPIDDRTVYTYLGSFEIDNDRLLIVSESLSGKAKRKEIYYHIFDKATAEFKTKLLKSYTVASDYKSGTVLFAFSGNRQYFGIAFNEHASRKDPKITHLTVIDLNGFAVSIENTVTFEDNFSNKAFVITDSGKVVLLRKHYGMKLQNNLWLVGNDNLTELPLQEGVLMQQPVAVSIGQKEYLVGFNYSSKGIRSSDFNKLLLYDIDAGQLVNNNEVKAFDKVQELKDVVIRRIDVINESVNVFVEAKYKVGIKAYKSNSLSAVEISTDAYSYGHPHQIVMDYSGNIQVVKPLKRFYDRLSEIHHSFNVVLNAGDYYVIDDYGFSPLEDLGTAGYRNSRNPKDHRFNNAVWINQLSIYKPDTKEVVMTKYADGKMQLVHCKVSEEK